jgi:hypothetical protein
MQFKGTCIAVEDSSYQSKRGGVVGQMTLTCFDADTVSRLKDTVDVVLQNTIESRNIRLTRRSHLMCVTFELDAVRDSDSTRGWSYRKAENDFSLMEGPEVHIDTAVLAAVWDIHIRG